jgi:uncharacterized protein (DUF1501 family)
MERREFLSSTGKVVLLGSVIPGYSFASIGNGSILEQLLAPQYTVNDNVLVLIQLNGGNDGLNTVIPLDQYSTLSNLRKNILLAENKVLKLSDHPNVGLHPSLAGLHAMYGEGKVNLIQGVGYPQQNYSHFRSTDIWLSGSDADKVVPTGWMGRYMNFEYTNFPSGFPNADMPDPLAIQIGSFTSPVFQGPTCQTAVAISSEKDFYDMVNNIPSTLPNNAVGKELGYVRSIVGQAQSYNTAIKNAAAKVTQQYSGYPTGNTLAGQLKIVAKLIKGGLKTKVYMVTLGSFDTHSGQVDLNDTSTGTHAKLLATLNDAISAFQKDLNFLGIEDRVIGMTFSEFGRRIVSNGSGGTDHGSSLPVIVFGSQVQNGVIGTNPQIAATTGVNDNLAMQYDFRSVYASILNQWFCVPTSDLNTILLKNFQTLPIAKSASCSSSIHEINQNAGIKWISCYPNPFVDQVTIEYTTLGGHTMIQVFDTEGRVVAHLVDQLLHHNTYTIVWNSEMYPEGIYYVRFQNDTIQQVATIIKTR